jgi:hypothetical protein
VTSVEIPSQDFHYEDVEIQESKVSIISSTFSLFKPIDKDTKNIYLSVGIHAPNLGFYGPVVKHHGFRHHIGPEEISIDENLTLPFKEVIGGGKTMEFNFSRVETLQECQLTMDHTLCFMLEEEVVTVHMDDEDEADGTAAVAQSKSAHNHEHYGADRVGEQIARDIEQGYIKDRNIVFTRNYLGGYEIPLQTIINIGTDGEPIYSINGILLDSNLASCGMLEFKVAITRGKYFIRQHH